MPRPPIFIDATTFLGMHHADEEIRERCLRLFRALFHDEVLMNLEQVGLCDAIVWRQPRQVQDAYYPFMDVLHSDMRICRIGYRLEDLEWALGSAELRQLRPEQSLLAAQVVAAEGCLFTLDPALLGLAELRPFLGNFSDMSKAARFPGGLEALYDQSRIFTVTAEDYDHVGKRNIDTTRHAR